MLSEPEYRARVQQHVQIPMRDGVRLSAHLNMPDVSEADAHRQFPAIIEYTPYHKGAYTETPERFRYFVERGYVVVNFDVRGTGDSEGITTDVYSDDERRDGYEMVEWCARQPWCNGNVGMMGISYCAVVCWHVAMQAPPSLKAIIVRCGTEDIYTEWTNPGGCLRPYMYENYAPLMTAYNLEPPNPQFVGDRWADIWKQRLEHNVPWSIAWITHQTDGPYWRDRSLRPDYDRVKCAVFVIDGQADWYVTPLMRAFANLKTPKRALIGPWSHQFSDWAIPGPRVDGQREHLKWFDQFLKGHDTGVLREPPVTIWVRDYREPSFLCIEDNGTFRAENEWPIARTREHTMPLNAGAIEYRPDVGIMSGWHGCGPFPGWGMPLDQRDDEIHSLVTTTEPLDEDWEITGSPRAHLRVSSTADISMLAVKLCDVAPDGTSNFITRGYLNLAHRESSTHPTPIEPGTIYDIDIDLLTVMYRVQKGHRVRVAIACADLRHCWPTPKRCVNTIHDGSRMVLPIVGPQNPKLPEPDLNPSPYPLPRAEELPRPEYSLTQDLVNDTATVHYATGIGAGRAAADYTVSRKNPAEATCVATYNLRKSMPGMDVAIQTQCITRSDDRSFHHVVQADITINGRPHFQKTWTVSVPRVMC